MSPFHAWLSGLQFFLGMAGIIGGMFLLRTGLEQVAIGRLAAVIRQCVKTPTRGLLTGGVITALLHSSAAVTLITMGLVSAGSMTFENSIGVILGANIGTCITTQLLSFQLDPLIIPLLIAGILLYLVSSPHSLWRAASWVVIGFGILILSLKWISGALAPLSSQSWFLHLLSLSAAGPLAGFVIGMLLTALLTSSTATTTLAIALTSQHLLSLESGIAIVIGSNVGTCITAVLASLGGPLSSGRVALAHVLVNTAGAVVFLPLLTPFAALVRLLSADPGVQTATSHTLFNAISSLLLLPFVNPLAVLIRKLLPDRTAH
ncbi:MAG: Na/Pi-cotransporter II-like protein [Bacilli bacterium]|nr:Na/Pi-cotransporter II-like protein [Bacilli bacterium]